MNESELRGRILELVSQYHSAHFLHKEFIPGKTSIPCSGKVFDEQELIHLVDASLDFWLTTGRYADAFESKLAGYLGVNHAMLCNSGSSANLLAVSALTSPKLGDRQLRSGDEVITIAAGFPTTLNPIIQNNLTPVFCDVDLGTYNIDCRSLENALSEKTRAIILPHTLGNPFNIDAIQSFARINDLWLIEDNCDALGSRYKGRFTGTFGDLATLSFYPAHHITMGEGGCVVTDSQELKIIVDSFRDWGRDCWCPPGRDNTCRRRFSWQLGDLPPGYDHKYTYSHIGYNLKLTDMQAAIGVAQLDKLDGFIEARRRNWEALKRGLAPLEDYIHLPEATMHSDPSWFGFLITLRDNAKITRNEMIQHLESANIATRLLFGGNLVKQPAYAGVPHRVADPLTNTDLIMRNTFWIGVYPGITPEMIEYMISQVRIKLTSTP